jgi:hypothetical protein
MKTATALILGTSTAFFSVMGMLTASAASAASFNFSYSFLSGKVLSGTVDGDLDANVPNKVINLRNLSATYSGVPSFVFDTIDPNTSNNSFYLDESKIEINGASTTDPSAQFFISYDSSNQVGGAAAFKTSAPIFVDSDNAGSFSLNNFQVSQAGRTPEPSTMGAIALLGIGLVSRQVRKRHN